MGSCGMLVSSVQSITFISFWVSDQTCLFLAASVISCFLGGILAAFVGVALTARRSVGECENGGYKVQVAYRVERGGGEERQKKEAFAAPSPSPSLFPFCASYADQRVHSEHALHAHLHLLRVILHHSDQALFFKLPKDFLPAILLSIILVFLPAYFRVSQYSYSTETKLYKADQTILCIDREKMP